MAQQCILAYFPAGNTETAFLKFNFNGMPMDEGSFGRRWLVIFFGGLTDVSRLATSISTESAGVSEKRLWLTGMNVSARQPALNRWTAMDKLHCDHASSPNRRRGLSQLWRQDIFIPENIFIINNFTKYPNSTSSSSSSFICSINQF